MKLRAYLTFDADHENFKDAMKFQNRVEEVVATLGKEFENVQFNIKVRRDRKPKVPGSEKK